MEPMEPRYLLSADLLPIQMGADGDADDFSLRLHTDALGLDHVQVVDNLDGTIVDQRLLQETSGVAITGSQFDDRLSIELESFIPFALPQGILFDAGQGADMLELLGSQFDSVDYGLLDTGQGHVDFAANGSALGLDFSGIQDLTDKLDAAARLFRNDSGASQSLRLGDDGTAGDEVSVLESVGVDLLTPITFDSPTAMLMLQAGDLGDTLIIGKLDLDAAVAVLEVRGGAGDDSYLLEQDWGEVSIAESAGGGTDTLDFSALNGDPVTVALNPLVISNGTNRVSFTAGSAAQIESLTGADIDISGSADALKTELLDGLQQTVDFVRNAAEVGDLATELPLIGGSAEVTVAKALDFAEALDEVRLEVGKFFDGIPGDLTTDKLLERLNTELAGVLDHLGAAVLSPKALIDSDVSAGDLYQFALVIDGEAVALSATGAERPGRVGRRARSRPGLGRRNRGQDRRNAARRQDRPAGARRADRRLLGRGCGRERQQAGLHGGSAGRTRQGR